MPLSVKTRSRWNWRSLLPWVIGLLPLVFGLMVMNWQIDRDLRTSSQATTRQVVAQIERVLDNLAGAAQALLPLAGTPCVEAQLALRGEVTRNAFVRSTNLVRDNTLYCSSLFGEFDEPVDAAE